MALQNTAQEVLEFLRTKMEIPEHVRRLELVLELETLLIITCTYYPKKVDNDH